MLRQKYRKKGTLEDLVQSRKYPSAVKQTAKTAGIEKYGFVVLLYTKSSFHPTYIESY